MTNRVKLERDGDVAVIVIDNPPVNASSTEVRAGLLSAIHMLRDDPALQAGVLIGAGRTFIAGADIREFARPLEDPQLPSVIAAIETCGKPVVAAMHGAALGGGFELALGCDARVAQVGTVVGLPEVALGIIPGAGGTQRLPRIVGVARAIRMICGSERVKADQAHALGMVDEVADADLRGTAVRHARAMAGRKSALRDKPVPSVNEGEVAAAAEEAARSGRRRPAVLAAIELIRSAATQSIDEALVVERGVFQSLRLTRESLALRHQFFAERATAKVPMIEGMKPRPIQRLLVVGAGTMGTGIAIAALDAGLDVQLLDLDDAAVQRGVERIRTHYAGRVAAGKLKAGAAAGNEARLQGSSDWTVASSVDAVIEAVFEDMDVKQQVFRQLDVVIRPDTVLATNTSYLDIDAIAQATRHPHNVLGLHFFSPANLMRLVEVVHGGHTNPQFIADGFALARRLGKLPVLAGNGHGFIGNRIFAAYRRQCEFMVEEGASPEQVDDALEAFGFAMGPFAVADLSGLDIAWRMRQSQAALRDPSERYVHIADRLCAMGRLGRKTGAGYYLYQGQPGKPQRKSDPVVHTLIAAESAAKGITRCEISASDIQRRAMLAMVNEAALVMTAGVAQRAGDIDVVLVNGYGFPRWEGGPVFWARERGLEALEADMGWLAERSGRGFVRGTLRALFAADPA